MKKGAVFYILLFIIFIFFQNCSYFGNVVINDQSSTFKSQNGNGGGYDGKLHFVIFYKDQEFYQDKVVMYSGETMKFIINGGQAPYTYQIKGKGTFYKDTQTYTSPFYANSPQFESIIVTDSLGVMGEISIQINSFLGLNKLLFPNVNSQVSMTTATNLAQSSNGDLFTIATYTDYQHQRNSILRVSKDDGQSWTSLNEFKKLEAIVYINPFNNDIYVVSIYLDQVYVSKDFGQSWILHLNKESDLILGNYTSVEKLNFISENKIMVIGKRYSKEKNNLTNYWTTQISNDEGATWVETDLFQKQDITFQTHAVDSIILPSGDIYVVGNTGTGGGTITSFVVRKSIDHGNSWTTDFEFSSPISVLTSTSVSSIASDSFGNLFVVATVNDNTSRHFPHWNIFKKKIGDLNWILVKDYQYKQQAYIPHLIISKNNDIYVSGYGVDPMGPTGETTYPILIKSSDSGVNWSLVSDRSGTLPSDNVYFSRINYLTDLNGNFLITGVRIENKIQKAVVFKSLDFGVTWTPIDIFVAKSEVGGDFIATGFVEYSENIFFMSGYGQNPKNNSVDKWLVLKSIDSGGNWQIVDEFSSFDHSENESRANNIFKDSKGNLFVIGMSRDGNYDERWVVRRSTDQGGNWLSVDDFSSPQTSIASYGNHAKSITEDSSGNLYVIGTIYDDKYNLLRGFGESFRSTVVRKSINGGSTWNTILQFGYYSNPMFIKSCFGNELFLLSSDYKNGAFLNYKKSLDGGVSWNDYQLPVNISTSSIIENLTFECTNKGEIFYITSMVNSNNPAEPALSFNKSNDHGVTWKSQTIDFKNSSLNSFSIKDINFDGNYFWFVGSILSAGEYEYSVYSNWTVVKSSLDLSEHFIIDQFVDPKSNSEATKIAPCGKEMCVLGQNKNPVGGETFSILRAISKKQ